MFLILVYLFYNIGLCKGFLGWVKRNNGYKEKVEFFLVVIVRFFSFFFFSYSSFIGYIIYLNDRGFRRIYGFYVIFVFNFKGCYR